MLRKSGGEAQLELEHPRERCGRSGSPQRPGRVNLQPLAAAAEGVIGAVHREEAAATVEVGEVAGLEMLPAAIGDARRQHRIEHGAARGREHETPLLRRETAQVLAGAREIRAIATEALRAEVIRYPAARELPKAQGEAVREPRAVTVHGEQAHHEAIAGERAARELARVVMSLQHLELGAAHLGPADGGARLRHREPLDGDRPPILQAGIPHIARPTAREPRQLARHPLGVGVALAHPQQQVLTGAGGREAEILLDHEVRRRGAQHRRRQRRAVRARRSERGRARAEAYRRHAYSSLSSTTACAAMPSARPRKPRPSVVVALMLTRCSSTFSSCAICRRMASR